MNSTDATDSWNPAPRSVVLSEAPDRLHLWLALGSALAGFDATMAAVGAFVRERAAASRGEDRETTSAHSGSLFLGCTCWKRVGG